MSTKGILISLFLFSVSLSQAAMAYSGGSGTPADPYQIASKADLLQLASTPAHYGKSFILMTDVDLTGEAFTTAVIAPDPCDAIGGFSGTMFTGFFNGNHRSITGLTIDDGGTGNDFLGLFGSVGTGGGVKYLTVDCTVKGSSGSVSVGGIAGQLYEGSIDICSVSGSVSGYQYAGGVVGFNSRGNVYRSSSSATVSNPGGSYAGGIVGYNAFGKMAFCVATGNVVGGNSVGGLAGYTEGTALNCYSWANVTGQDYVGGALGSTDGSTTNCYSVGTVTGTSYVGGFQGSKGSGSTIGCFWDMETSGVPSSADGTGKSTAAMQDVSTFLAAGWDFAGETTNGSANYWTMGAGPSYPVLSNNALASGDIVRVPQDYATIQAAIDIATPGDQVVIAPGTYKGTGNTNLTFRGKAITVRSENPADANVVAATQIDCQNLSNTRGVAFTKGEGPGSVLSGITIQNGVYYSGSPLWTSAGYVSGFAVYCTASSPTIENCVFISTTTSITVGHAACFTNSNAVVRGCTISNSNSLGIHVEGGPVMVEKCMVKGNRQNALTSYHGNVDISQCIFMDNYNSGATSRYFMRTYGTSTAVFSNCTIMNCGMFDIREKSTLTFNNCILGRIEGSAPKAVDMSGGGAKVTFNYCGMRWGGESISASDPAIVVWGAGNFQTGLDMGLTTGYRLKPSSVCINKGDPAYVGSPGETDFYGQPRVTGGVVDVGATEAALAIQLASPQKGDIFAAGSTRNIQWKSSGATVNIYYTPSREVDWIPIATGVPNTGSYPWTVPAQASAAYRVLVEGIDGSSKVRAESGVFEVRPYTAGATVAPLWATLGGNSQRRGFIGRSGPVTGNIKWTFDAGGPVNNSVAVGADGTIYVASDRGVVYAVDASGQMVWSIDLGAEIGSSPSIGRDGTVYVGCANGELVALSQDGDIRWTKRTGGTITGAAAVGAGGWVFVGSQDGSVYAMDADGSDKWQWQSPHTTSGPAAMIAPVTLGTDGRVIVADAYWPVLYCLNQATGQVAWQVDFTQEITQKILQGSVYVYIPILYGRLMAAPAVGPDGTIYVSFDGVGKLCAVSSAGVRKWTTSVSDATQTLLSTYNYTYLDLMNESSWSEVVVGVGGSPIYLNMDDPLIRAFKTSGTMYWVTRCGLQGGFKLTAGADGCIYACGDEGSLYVLGPDGSLGTIYNGTGWMSYPVIAADGTVYISGNSGKVIAIGSDTAPDIRPDLRWMADAMSTRGVNFLDYAAILKDWGKTVWAYKTSSASPTAQDFMATDVNRDAYVDMFDIALVAQQWLQQ
jgi:outer membrane protein assembly factor BamB